MAKKQKLTQEMLLDVYEAHGTDSFELRRTVFTLADGTIAITLDGSRILPYLCTDNGTDDIIKACPANVVKSGSGHFIKLDNIRRRGNVASKWTPELWDEFSVQSKVAFSYSDDDGNNHFMPVTPRFLSDLACFGITGPAVMDGASYGLLIFLMEQLTKEKGKKVTLIIRRVETKAGPIEKVITIRSGSYAYIPQDDALELMFEVFADGTITDWSVNNFLTIVHALFPNTTVNITYGRKTCEMTSGMRFSTSDAGDSSLTFELQHLVNGRSVFLASGSNKAFRTHRGHWDENMKNELRTEALKLKDKFTILADRMAELQTITVKNQNIERVVRHLCSDAKITGKAVQEAFVRHVSNEFIGTDATAAEIVLSIIEAQDVEPELCDLSNVQKDMLKHKLGEVPYQRIRQHI